VAQSAGGGLSLDSKTQPETYPPSPFGDSLQRETKSSYNLSPFGGGSLQGGGGSSFIVCIYSPTPQKANIIV